MTRIAIITGGSAGIGRAAAVALAQRGVHSIVTFNRKEKEALLLADEAAAMGVKAIPLRLDVGRSEAFAGFRASVASVLEREWGTRTFDYLLNNAGFGQMALFEDTTEELFDEFMRVLLKGPYFLTQALLPLLADGGAIVNVASNSAMETGLEPGYSAYAAMKGGLIVLTRYMAKEFASRGIRVNAVSPGPTRTRIGEDAFDKHPEYIPPLVAKTALGRIGEPEDIGAVIAALLSGDCRWVTAQNIEASGGYKL